MLPIKFKIKCSKKELTQTEEKANLPNGNIPVKVIIIAWDSMKKGKM